MGNPAHVETVKLGAEAVRDWRAKNPEENLDLSYTTLEGIDLSNTDLSGAHLGWVNLTNAKLVNTILRDVSLYFADCSHADLSNADLSKAIIGSSIFRNAKLAGANLSDASLTSNTFHRTDLGKGDFSRADVLFCHFFRSNLTDVNFSQCDLSGSHFLASTLLKTNFSQADLSFTSFNGSEMDDVNMGAANMFSTSIIQSDLTKIVGLETTVHEGHSNVDFVTINTSFEKSGCKLTKEIRSYLANIGFPRGLIEQIPQILARVKYHTCFVCYGEPDLDFAAKLVEDLKARGVTAWLYNLDATVGKRTWTEITARRREAEKMIVLCSINALAREGVKKEIEEQVDEDIEKIVPISLDAHWKQEGFHVERTGRDLKHFLVERNYADFEATSYEKALEKLLKGIETH